MIKASQLVGRAVIDMEAAERLGRIREIIVQRDGERLAGFIVVHGETLLGTGGTRRMVPASAVHSIGPDAMTMRGSAMSERLPELDNLPRMSDIIGHKIITRSGRLLGVIDDMLINGADGTIVGLVVGEGVRNKLDAHPWEERAAAESKRSSIWTRRTDAQAQVRSEPPPAEPRLKSETARAVENSRSSLAEDTPVGPSPLDRDDEEVTITPGDKSRT